MTVKELENRLDAISLAMLQCSEIMLTEERNRRSYLKDHPKSLAATATTARYNRAKQLHDKLHAELEKAQLELVIAGYIQPEEIC